MTDIFGTRSSIASRRHLLPAALAFGLFCVLASIPELGAQSGDGHPSILLVHSYHPEYVWTSDLDAAIREELDASVGGHDLYTVYLDSKRHTLARVEDSVVELIRAKYRGLEFDVVIATDDNALLFLRDHRDALFGDVPVVFGGVNDRDQADSLSAAGFTGIVEVSDLEGNLDLIGRVHPDVARVAVVSDSTSTSTIVRAKLRALEPRYAERFTMRYLTDLTLAELREELRALPPDTAIFNIGFWRDRHDTPYESWEVLPALVGTGLPVYGLWESMVSHGVLGGVVVDATLHGRATAEIAVAVIEGRSPSSLPVRDEPTTRAHVDYEVMRSFGMRRTQFPRDTRFINIPDTLYHRRPQVFWQIIAIVAMQTTLSVLLLVSFLRRRSANRALRASLAEKETLLREVHHRVKNNLQVISSLLTLQTAHVTTPKQALSALADSERRVLSMSLVHEMLYGSSSLNHIQAGDYLETLGRQIVQGHRSPHREIDFTCRADRSIELGVDTAIPLGLIVSELISNSAKHARREGEQLRISLLLTADENTARVQHHDDGPGFCFDEARKNATLGLSLVDTLARQIDASLSYRNHNGSTFTIELPLDSVQR